MSEQQDRPIWARGLDDRTYDLALRGQFAVVAAAEYAGVSDKTIRKLINTGALEAKRIGNGFRIQKSSLDAYFGLS
ncbi:MAG TPA: helix-turn-helix domain-containing protein [Oscillatoriaceae cyanobacterium]